MPRFKRPTAEAQSTVQDFISVFERKLKADSYPTEKYVDALTACCHPEEADWVESSITHCQSWDEAKDRFLRHFIDEDIAKPGSPTQALRWCSYHRSPAHSDGEYQAQKRSDFHRPPATAKSGSTSQARRISTWCKHHKVNTHSTSECRLTNPSSTNATSSRVFPKSMLATSNATYAPISQRCHKCNKVGHYANRCPKLTNAAPVPTRHSSALVTNQSSNQNGFTTVYQEPEAESKDPTVEYFYELFSKQPSSHLSQSLSEQTGTDYNSAFLVPIIFESAKDAYTPRLGSIDLPFTCDNKTLTHKFEISDPPAGIQAIIGRDLFILLGITISGLPLP
ncbi:hypothetical protein BASA83_013311 [Batrachochytrium salamandrivorans]|nr:hypothetical protein BASA83_013311 [Batrachochytrium salamandrivorans]